MVKVLTKVNKSYMFSVDKKEIRKGSNHGKKDSYQKRFCSPVHD